ncbi:putative mitochondrial protein [Sesamum alatum]|uniref:Mitochondrial protein n=1 Tax=Sesamum alatum TaxID=300844 RepID=A0AAE2C7S6_9LAMI|nr:putative mitochondrial protein [Sesamum alatum]
MGQERNAPNSPYFIQAKAESEEETSAADEVAESGLLSSQATTIRDKVKGFSLGAPGAFTLGMLRGHFGRGFEFCDLPHRKGFRSSASSFLSAYPPGWGVLLSISIGQVNDLSKKEKKKPDAADRPHKHRKAARCPLRDFRCSTYVISPIESDRERDRTRKGQELQLPIAHYAIAEFGRFAAEFLTLFMGTCAVTGSSGGADLFGHGNPGNASSEFFTYTSDLEEDSASSGRSISTSSVNQPIPREQAGPSNAVPAPQPAAAPAAQQHNHLAAGPNNHEVVGGERMEDIVRRLLLKSDNPSAMDIRLAEIQAEDLFEVKAEIINRMAILHPEGDWENRGARALENSRTLTGEESLERLYRLRDDLVQNGIHSDNFRYLKNKVFLRDQNLDAQSQA